MKKEKGSEISELNVFCSLGVTNRLMAMAAGYAIARKIKCVFSMTWIKNSHCGCEFSDIFKINPAIPIKNKKEGDFKYHDSKDILNIKNKRVLNVCSWTWFNCPEVFADRNELIEESKKIIEELQPVEYIANEVSMYKNVFLKNKKIIGVHIRRGDFLTKKRKPANLEKFITEIKKRLQKNKDALIFVATDDGAPSPSGASTEKEGIICTLSNEFKGKVIFYSVRSLSRNSKEAVQDGFITFLLLRECTYFIGTRESTFSKMIASKKGLESLLL